MKKTWLTILLSVVLALSLFAVASCGGTKEPDEEEPKEPTTYTVTFDSDGGTAVVAQVIEEGLYATQPAAPTKEGFDFVQWLNGETPFVFATTTITADLTLKASWQKQIVYYTVTFDTDGGSNVSPKSVEENTACIIPTVVPTKVGFKFLGWYDGETAYDFATLVTADKTVKAKWEELPQYTVSFDSAGGSAVTEQSIYEGSVATAPANPTKGGDAFLGWFVGETKFDFTTKITADVELVAHWKAPTAITTAAQLKAIGTDETTMADSYYLANDIDLSLEEDWLCIGRKMGPEETGDGTILDFTGVLDGRGHKIIMPNGDFFVDYGGSSDLTGLFKINRGTLKNIWLSGNCDDVGNWTGLLVIDNWGKIENCYFDVNITSYDDQELIDGGSSLAFGSAICINNEDGGTISNCISVGEVNCVGNSWGLVSGILICNNKVPGSCSNLYCLGDATTDLVIGWEVTVAEESREQKCAVLTEDAMKVATLYADFDTDIWNIVEGEIPTLKVQE